jgi:hypothetical protein
MVCPVNDDGVLRDGLRPGDLRLGAVTEVAPPPTTSGPLAALATIVRTLGVLGPASDRVTLQAWARHVETGAPVLGAHQPATFTAVERGAADAPRSNGVSDDDRRDWSGLCGVVTRSLEHRAAEAARTIEALQEALAVVRQDRREQEDRDVIDDLMIREHTRLLARASDRDDAVALRALVRNATTALATLLDERCARRNQRALDGTNGPDNDTDNDTGDDTQNDTHDDPAHDGALVDEFVGVDDDEPTIPALRSPGLAGHRAAVAHWRQ